MAFAARDPYWRARVLDESATHVRRSAEIQDNCLRCHAPSYQHPLRGTAPCDLAKMTETGREGVTCTVCQRVDGGSLRRPDSFTGGFDVAKTDAIFGPHADPFVMPMLNSVTSAGQAVVYEAVLADENGVPTTSLLSARRFAKDKRILPARSREGLPKCDPAGRHCARHRLPSGFAGQQVRSEVARKPSAAERDGRIGVSERCTVRNRAPAAESKLRARS